MKKFITFLTLLSFGLLVSSAFATTYYVDELLGDDSNAGSQAAPWATIQKAADVMVAGDKAIVVFGTYAESVVPKNKGTASNPIVYMAEEKGEAEITSGDTSSTDLSFTLHSGTIYVMEDVFREVTSFTEDGTLLTEEDHVDSLVAGTWFQDRAEGKLYVWSSDGADPTSHTDIVFFNDPSFDIFEGSYITIDGFTIVEGIRAVVGANSVSLPGLVIQNNVFENDVLSHTVIYINGGEEDSVHTYEHFLIADNLFENNAQMRIYNAGRKSVVSGNTFNGDPLAGEGGSENIAVRGSADYPGVQCQGLVIERNFFNNNNHRCLYLQKGDIASVTVQNNIFFKGFFITIQAKQITNLDVINNTFFYNGDSHLSKIYSGVSGRLYNNVFADCRRGYTWFHDNKEDTTLLFDIDHNYYVTDTSLTSSRDDQLLRTRNPANSSSLPGGPHAVYGHPMVARADLPLHGDTLFTPVGDTVYVDSTRQLMTGDTVVVESVPDMWFQSAYPLFSADTGAAKPEDFILLEGSNAIDVAWAEVAPELDFFGNARDDKPDMGAVEIAAVGIEDLLNRLFPEKYELSQNYPNPFNLTTRIDYTLPKAGYVRLTVYNLLGQEVTTLVNGIRSPGTHSVMWNGLDDHGIVVPSGIYIYRMEAGSVSKTAKMLLLK